MAWTTGNISANILACAVDVQSGIGTSGYFINIQDIDKANTVVTNYRITSLALNPGAVAYEVDVLPTDEPDGGCKFIRGQYRDGWDHTFTIRLFTNDEATRIRVNEALRSRFAFMYQLFTPTGSYWEIAGFELGLEVLECERNYTDIETAGGWVMQIGTNDLYKEKDAPYIVGTAPGAAVVPVSTLQKFNGQLEDTDLVDGVYTVVADIATPVPVGFYLIQPTGEAVRYDVKKLDTYRTEVNIGEKLRAGTYDYKLLFTE